MNSPVSKLPNETHDPSLESWVESANRPDTDFPIQNLPFGVFHRRGTKEVPRGGVAIGDSILDLAACVDAGLFSGLTRDAANACLGATLNEFLALGPAYWSSLRLGISRLLRKGNPLAEELNSRKGSLLVDQADAILQLPLRIGDYSDFYCSYHHAENCGRIFKRPEAVRPNFHYMPVGYHGRASSIVVSGTDIVRPAGQIYLRESDHPAYERCRKLDYEFEFGTIIGTGNPLGRPIPIDEAGDHIFGMCMMNDWSARDIQTWESQPLGPFLSKSFATSLSPWIVTMEALAPFRVAPDRPQDDPKILPHLRPSSSEPGDAFDVTLDSCLRSARMQEEGAEPFLVSRHNLRTLHWTTAQMVAHHASNGCNLSPGDLFGSGTVSGPEPGTEGCLLERTHDGAKPIRLPTGEERGFLEDGDEVIFRAQCEAAGYRRIGFGICSGIIRG